MDVSQLSKPCTGLELRGRAIGIARSPGSGTNQSLAHDVVACVPAV